MIIKVKAQLSNSIYMINNNFYIKKNKPNLIVHVDVDSPIKLMNFYRINNVKFEKKELELFYETSWDRALVFFEKHNIKATFFVVGDEIESSVAIQNVILKAFKAGHEIENHTYSHPFGLASLSEDKIINEIIKCNKIIEKVTGCIPVGFRSPGYSINPKIINLLEKNGFEYDSSGFWSIMNPLLKISHRFIFKNGLKNEGFGNITRKLPQKPYKPVKNNLLLKSNNNRKIWELPLPRTVILGLPFYNNFNLWIPFFFSNYFSSYIRKPYIVYLFHIIEFMDLKDNLPKELKLHPNLKTPLDIKLRRSDIIINNLCKHYELIKTREFMQKLNNESIS